MPARTPKQHAERFVDSLCLGGPGHRSAKNAGLGALVPAGRCLACCLAFASGVEREALVCAAVHLEDEADKRIREQGCGISDTDVQTLRWSASAVRALATKEDK